MTFQFSSGQWLGTNNTLPDPNVDPVLGHCMASFGHNELTHWYVEHMKPSFWPMITCIFYVPRSAWGSHDCSESWNCHIAVNTSTVSKYRNNKCNIIIYLTKNHGVTPRMVASQTWSIFLVACPYIKVNTILNFVPVTAVCRRHLSNAFSLNGNIWMSIKTSLFLRIRMTISQLGSGEGLAPNRRQAITQTRWWSNVTVTSA